jgi:hypothetical protein
MHDLPPEQRRVLVVVAEAFRAANEPPETAR